MLDVQNETEAINRCTSYFPAQNAVVPDAIDWRQSGYVTPVKGQVSQ